MHYKIHIADNNYNSYSIYKDGTFEEIELDIGNAFKKKLFNQDIFTFEDEKINIIHSSTRSMKTIPGVIVLDDGKKYGRHKDKFLYRCVPDDKRLPMFVIPHKVKITFNKKLYNKYITFKFRKWENKNPVGEIVSVLGEVNVLDNFYEYQLYCKSLYMSIQNFTKETMKKLRKQTEEYLIKEIQKKYKVESRISEKVIAIDPKTSVDFDDAFSYSQTDTHHILSIYIANVSFWLDTLELWESFSKRISTIYLPDRKRPMLPTVLSDTLCSLRENSIRYAFTLDIYINNKTLEIEKYKYLNTAIKITKNYSYEGGDILKDDVFVTVNSLLKKLNKKYKYVDDIKSTHEVISYLMILMNYISAKEMKKYEVGIYRYAKTNEKFKPPSNIPDNVQKFLKMWNSFGGQYCKFSDIQGHDMLNLEAYLHITSPIRRLVDLLNIMILQSKLGLVQWGDAANNFYNYWTSETSLEYINKTMRSIRKVQNDCSLLNICYNNDVLLNADHTGFIFDKIKRNDDLYQYMVYLPELKLINRITTRYDKVNFSKHIFKIVLFMDKTRLKQKIRIMFLE